MPKATTRPDLAKRIMTAALLVAGCSTPSLWDTPVAAQLPQDARFARFAADIATDAADTQMLSAPSGTCGPASVPVVRVMFPERVLFATASDQPGPQAGGALTDLASLITQDASDADITVLGHTDAIGSDAYNMDLSKRRAVTVLRALVERGLDTNRLTAVAIGKRQPVADNATQEGRARNRRVEFLVSRCLAANLGIVAAAPRERVFLAQDQDLNRPVEVMRLDATGTYGLALLRTISLRPLGGPPGLVRPAPPPHYQPRTLSPGAQPNTLGPPVPF
jgi:outer membrane protein OmpA-like peptidoglycan-associated protein